MANQDTWTIKRLLDWIAGYFEEKGVDAPRLSAEMLMSHILGLPRIELYVRFNTEVPPDQLATLRQLVKRAAASEPIAYLVGRTEFYSMPIHVSRDCLIPRPETELLVERAIEFLRRREGHQDVLDLCTGSGCIAAAIAKNHPQARVVATDISDTALSVAAQNVQALGLKDRVELLCGDLYTPLIEGLDPVPFDLIASNPPYVTTQEMGELAPNVKDYEPHQALHGGDDGLEVIRRIVQGVEQFLKPDAALMLEIGYKHGPAVTQLLESSALFTSVRVEKDLAKHDRIIIATRGA